jgi:uncharacterized protein (TIGR00725 family)
MKFVSVIGGASAQSSDLDAARLLGEELAACGYAVVCGGMGGVMAAVCQGAASRGGVTVGVLPGDNPHDANPFVGIPIPTGTGSARNRAVVLSGFVVCAIDGGYGTLSEIAFALQAGKPVCVIGEWSQIPGVTPVKTVDEMMAFVRQAEGNRDAKR